MKHTLSICLMFFACSFLTEGTLLGQKGSNSQTGGPQPAQQSQGPQGNPTSAAPAGITGGSSPIESTLFSYAALAADANAISGGIAQRVGAGSTLILTTSNDVSAFVQWRTVIGQGELLLGRIRDAQYELQNVGANAAIAAACVPVGAPPPPAAGQLPKVGSPFFASPSDVQAAIQTIASMTAVNETLAPSSGSMTDLPLLNLVGDSLKTNSTVFVPSLLSPGIFDDTDLGNGPLVNILWDLEYERAAANQTMNVALGRIADWQIAATNKGNACTNAQAALAASLVATWTPRSQAVSAALTAIDGFEASLFSGQAPAPSGNQTTQNANAPTQNAIPGAMPAPPIPAANPSQSQAPSSPTQASQPSQQAGTALQQIFAVDLLYQQLPRVPDPDGPTSTKHLHFVELHSLESGGGLLTKSNLFLGSRLYFSGGAVATFTLFDHSGKVECGGIAYAYQGYVKPQDVANRLGPAITAVLRSSCQPSR